MPVEIRELRVSEVDDAIAFVAQYGSDTRADAVRASMSLRAVDDGATVGVLLTVASGHEGHEMELAAADPADLPLCRRLLNTALFKMRSDHIGKSRIRIIGSPEAALELWVSANWTLDALTAGDADGQAA